MKVVQQTAGRLVLQEKPWLVWLVGGLFVVAGSGVALMSSERLFGAAFAVTGAVLILGFANTVTATFDRDARRFTRSITGLLRNSETGHPLGEVVSIDVEASPSANPSRAHRLVLGLSTGARFPLTSSYSSGKQDKEQTAGVIRQFLDLRGAPDVPLPGFRDMVSMMFDPNAAERLGEMYGGAVAAYEEIVRREPDSIEARRQLGVALALQNRGAEARPHLEAARDLAARRGNPALAAEIDEMLRRLNQAASRRT